ncbi:HAMP domain-containing histidine kinase [Hymenobacter sp. NST-14]|uniref:sensor histidine kinase n=1 Tax=Hymenobacter piscis TaxID=2839984 RepID=UPI001C01378E|nr:HAMP domain-containing sensor histidine kinase [Hymenobacter piscis]MBT9392717.1 HAMP domain-containing histidine kinase [Hymenobacter piscis]
MSPQPEPLRPPLDLRLTQENLEDLYDDAPCGYCSCLPDGTLVKVNRTLLTWLGYERTELVARRCFQELLTVGGRLHYETYFVSLLLLRGQAREISYQLCRANGASLPVLLNATLVRDTDGEPLVVRITLFDITERRKYEQELLRARAQAEQQGEDLARANDQLTRQNEELTRINADLDSFVYTASHDLRQPINNMAGIFAELKRTATFHDPEAEGMVGMFEEALGQIMTTITGLTEVVQLQRQLAPEAEEVLLAPLLEEVINALRPQLQEMAGTFLVDVAAVPSVRIGRSGLHSMLYNLLSNALKYAQIGRPPEVRVRADRAEDGAPVLTVQDNGRGIDLERHGRELFQLFRRFHPEVPGSGLGLYLVNRLVHQAGGQLDVSSVVGEGTTFRIRLPR